LSVERLGIPAAAVITDRFASLARSMAELSGLPDYPFVEIVHPIAENTDAELRDKAEQVVRQLVGVLTERRPG
jgi:hypothetical protein